MTADQFVLLAALSETDAPHASRELVSRTSSDPNTLRAMLSFLLERRQLIKRRPRTLQTSWLVKRLSDEKVGESCCRDLAANRAASGSRLVAEFDLAAGRVALTDELTGSQTPSSPRELAGPEPHDHLHAS